MSRWPGDWNLAFVPKELGMVSKKKTATRKVASKKTASQKKPLTPQRTRKHRPYPSWPYQEALTLALAIQEHASGERVAKLTLLGKLSKSAESSQTHGLITNSGKYGLTKGSYAAEYLELTPAGALVTSDLTKEVDKLKGNFDLSIAAIKPFGLLYDKYKNKRLPAHEILSDALKEGELDIEDTKECIDIFVVNLKYLGLLKTIAGAETLIAIEARVAEFGESTSPPNGTTHIDASISGTVAASKKASSNSQISRDWTKTCFYITPIGEASSDERKHSDLFLSQLVEPALETAQPGMELVRADQIADSGLITAQIFEYIFKSRLVIVDLSFHNPNVFYEMALRHATKLPIVQISRKKDRLPFDVNQVRTILIDNNDIYSFLPNLESYKSEISMQIRSALNGSASENPISVFFPSAQLIIK